MTGSSASMKVLVVGSINVDLYQHLASGKAAFATKAVDITPIKGMTLPAANFLRTPTIAAAVEAAGLKCKANGEEALVLSMDGPFTQKTGGKGANAAAAAGQTWPSEFIGNFGASSAAENLALREDLASFGQVDVSRCTTLEAAPTGTAYILLFDDNDNAIILIGGANQLWPPAAALKTGPEGESLRSAVSECVCVMLQREVPDYVNLATARLAAEAGKPVFMDVGGTDAPLDEALLPFITCIAPNESELTFIAGVPTSDGDGADAAISPAKVRAAVSALKQKFAAAGNTGVEVLVTLGGMGSCFFAKGWEGGGGSGAEQLECRMGVFPLETDDGKPKDTTGAGDCFRGSFVGARYGEGKTVEEAMKWAAAAGSLSVEVEGAMPSMPHRSKIEQRVTKPMSELGAF